MLIQIILVFYVTPALTEPDNVQSVSLNNQCIRNCALQNSVQDRFWNVLNFRGEGV